MQRELERQIEKLPIDTQADALELVILAKRAIAWAKNLKQKNKLCSLHERAVDCISNSKVHKRYEFGTKVGVVTTQKEGIVVAMRSYPGNPYVGHTLDDQLRQAQIIS